jgi:hypothetical protein
MTLRLEIARQRLGVRQPSAAVRAAYTLFKSARGLAQSKSFANSVLEDRPHVSQKYE